MTDVRPPSPNNPDADAGMTPLKRAFLALEDTRARLAAAEAAQREPIAVIGLGCRVPGGGDDAASFWALMRDGVDAIGPLPADRWDVQALYDPDPDRPGHIATRAGGFIGDPRGFDPALFGIARREAQGMDPQQRLLLEVAWEALENAGQPPDRLEHSATGVYIGVTGSDYAYLQFETRDRELLDPHFASGIAHSIVSGRLSYLLGLQGPALTIDTACSSSLVAIHLACQALRAGDCRMALAGGVNLILSPDLYIALSRSRMLAPDGRCKTFDAAADGFARGEGCGVIVLKRLSQARADGDRVLAVIRGSALNQDGPSSGLTAPNGPAQEAVIREALARAGVAPQQVGFIEAHGTGTQLGDPLEVAALGAVFGPGRDPARPLLIGSVKTNIGHLEAAAGVTGLIKLVLSLRERAIPAHLHFHTPSPHIPWGEHAMRVPTALTPWEPIEGRRIAGVSSFGFSGTNAHIVVEEAPAEVTADAASVAAGPASLLRLFVLSARDETALRAMASRYAEAFAPLPDSALADVCFTAAAGRAHLPQRAVVLARNMAELRVRLRAIAEGADVDGVRRARVQRRDPARIAFLFTGQGAQYAGMARQLDDTQPVFRAALDRCAAVLDSRLPRPLREVLNPLPNQPPLIDETACTQPALFAVEYALAELWRAWGVQPDVLIGHSVGEYVAACLGGVLTLEDALVLVAERGRLMQSLPAGGAMAAVFAAEAEVAAAAAPFVRELSIAAQNGPLQTVVSGTAAAVDAVCADFTRRGVRCQRLPVSHAFHSPLVEPVLDAFEAAVARARLRPPTLRIVSNLTGAPLDAREVVQPRYWRRHVREAVRFADGMRSLMALKPDVCLEVGPHATLLAFAQANLEDTPEAARPALVATLRKGRDDGEQLAEALGALYLVGVSIDWRAVWQATPHRWVDLPTYAFQRESFWFPRRAVAAATGHGRDTGHPLLGARVRSALAEVVQFEQTLRADSLPYLDDHRVQGVAILPATGFLEMALAAGREVLAAPCEVLDMAILEPLRFVDDELRVVQVIVRPGAGGASLEVLSCPAAGGDTQAWRRHAECRLEALASPPAAEPLAALHARCAEPLAVQDHHAQLASRGLVFGPSLRGLQQLRCGDDEALGEVVLPDPALAGRGPYLLHPALLDACLQVLSAALGQGARSRATAGRAYLPLAIDALTLQRTPRGPVWSHARALPAPNGRADMIKGEVTVYDAEGVVAALRGISLRAASNEGTPAAAPLYEIAWEPLAAEDALWLPTPAALHAAAGPALPALAQEHGLDAYQRAFVDLEALSTEWVIAAFTELGWTGAAGDSVSLDPMCQRLAVLPRYRRLVRRFLDILAEDGWLRADTGGWCVVKPLQGAAAPALQARLDALLERHPGSRARLMLAGRCGPELARILRGAIDPLQQLFPGGSTELAESLYRDAPEARAFNQLVREAVKAAVDALPDGRRLRVLEVGGGTGGTTAWVAPALPAERTEYLFTDIGPSMVLRAREKFAAHAFMDFRTLDLEQPPAGQGLADASFDLVLASNVVHATADLRQTLARLRGLLAPGGTLLMLEVAGLERWIDITFGLTEGWWGFRDTELRADYPLLSRAAWLELLASMQMEAAAIGDADPRSREVLLAARRSAGPDTAAGGAGRWLVVGDGQGLAGALAAPLQAAGHEVLLAAADGTLRDRVAQLASGLSGVLHLAGLDLPVPDPQAAASLLPQQQRSLGSLVEVVQGLGGASFDAGRTPRLVVVTRGAVPAGRLGEAELQVAQAPLAGLGKVIALEHPELRTLRIDLDPAEPAGAQAEALWARVQQSSREDQLARRSAGWWAARLVSSAAAGQGPMPVRLEKGAGGSLDELHLQPVARRAPGPGEIEIRVAAGGLNFRDVMNAVAMRDDPEPLGGECAGRVVAVGAGVTDLAVGDHVVAIAEASFATYATTTTPLARRLPETLSFAEAATLPFAFMTAEHALHTLGALARGESVLIHAGAGGVGMAAIQLAQAAGAVIYATAGSEAKRAMLRSLGVPHVMDSRSLDFVRQVQQLTGGRGVDLVLNSLAGDFIGASVRCLGPQGRFLEIGKRDIWSEAQFAEVRPLGRYHAIDLAAMRNDAPAEAAALFTRILQRLERGEIRPLPLQAFDLTRAAEAFRFMAMARHTGKVVLTQPDGAAGSLRALDTRAAYLVTGGLSGLGLLTARHLVERGARHLTLVGRRAPSAAALAAFDGMRALGAQVVALQADMARPDEVRRVLDGIALATPLRGIVHCAGLLEDGALLQQRWERFVLPLGPKVDGAWALHALTRHRRLDFFVLYSSIASVLGSSGQGNHAAANSFMDLLAWQRRSAGLPALSIGWGAWSEVGAAADRGVDSSADARGIGTISPERGLAWLDMLMDGAAPHVAVFPVRWADFLARPGMDTPFVAHLLEASRGNAAAARTAAGAAPAVAAASILERLGEANAARRHELLLGFVGEQVARVIGAASGEAIDPRQPLNELGLDSLMAVELRNRLGSGLGLARSLPATLVFDHPTLEALAVHLASAVLPAQPQAAVAAPAAAADAVGAIDDLSDEEIEKLFAKKMRRS